VSASSCDLVVVGAGPAGVACAVQAVHDGLSVAVVGDEPVGGIVRAARRLDNLPAGLDGLSGEALAGLLEEDLERCSVPVLTERVEELHRDGPRFEARLSDGRPLAARAVVLATGTVPRDWEVRGLRLAAAAKLAHWDVRSLPPCLDGRQVLVVGGGEAALDCALTVRDRGGEVVVAIRGGAPRAAPRLVAEAREGGVELLPGLVVERMALGVNLAVALRTPHGETVGLRCDHVVVNIGRRPRADLAEALAPGSVAAGRVATEVPGLFLAGDVIRGRDRYVATAFGDGQRAARAAAAVLETTRKPAP